MFFVDFHHVAYGVPAVVAGRDDHFSACGLDLLQLVGKSHVALLPVNADAVQAAAAAATEVVVAFGAHFAKIFSNIAHDFAGSHAKAVVAHVVARILKGAGDLDFFGRINLDLAIAQHFGHPFHIVHEAHRRIAALTSGPVGAFNDGGAVGMPALGSHNHFGLDALNGGVNTLDVLRAAFPVTGEHGQRSIFPAFARHSPVGVGHVEEDGGQSNIFRIVLNLAGVENVHDVGMFLFNGDFEVGPFFLLLFHHPFTGFEPVFFAYVHLSAVHAVHAGADLHFPRNKAVLEKNAAQIAEHDAGVDAVRAVNGAAVAAGALAPGSIHAFDHERGVDLALAAQKLAQSRLYLVRGDLGGVIIVCSVKEAAVGAHGTVGTDVEPRAGA